LQLELTPSQAPAIAHDRQGKV